MPSLTFKGNEIGYVIAETAMLLIKKQEDVTDVHARIIGLILVKGLGLSFDPFKEEPQFKVSDGEITITIVNITSKVDFSILLNVEHTNN